MKIIKPQVESEYHLADIFKSTFGVILIQIIFKRSFAFFLQYE